MEFVDLIPVHKVDFLVFTEKTNDKLVTFEGTLCLSDHHLLLSSRQELGRDLLLLYRNIDVIERKTNNQSGSGIGGGSIILKCKDFRVFQLDINSTADLMQVASSLEKLASLDQTLQYPFFYRPQSLNQNKNLPQGEDGWTAFTPVSEWSRLLAAHGDEWRISYLNRDYRVCNSYPSTIVVPRMIDDQVILASAAFRDRGRFPILCYRHDGGSFLFRSGQPLCGATGKRCIEDERLLNVVLGAGRRGYIIDTRSTSQAAQSARSKGGGGTEIDSAYPQWKKLFMSIPRLSELTDSLYKLIEACDDTASCSTSQWLSRLENSGWLATIPSAMDAACVVAQCLHHELSAVLVHGGTGRDSTLVITSLAQVILNPDCRTIRGLEALIEREWLQAGHPFYTRTRHGAYYNSSSSSNNQNFLHAPTFLLFLDCLYQLFYQFQYSFEYTTAMLVELFKHAYCSEYGTFLGDSEAERISLRLSQRTCSLWTYMNKPESLEHWLNPLYEPNPGVIWPSVAPISIHLWRELYLEKSSSFSWEGFITCVNEIKEKHLAVRKKANQLRAQVGRALDKIVCGPDLYTCTTETDCEGNDQQQQRPLTPCFTKLEISESQKI